MTESIISKGMNFLTLYNVISSQEKNLEDIIKFYYSNESRKDIIIDYALQENQTDFVKWLIDKEGEQQTIHINFLIIESINLAVRTGDVEIVQKLSNIPRFNLDFIVSEKYENRFCTLQRPVDDSIIYKNVTSSDRQKVLELLTEMGIPTDFPSRYNNETWLHLSVRDNQIELVNLLLEKGADPNFQNMKGKSPLHIACENGFEEIVEILIKKGADMYLSDRKFNVPVILAIKNNFIRIVQIFLKLGYSVDFKNDLGITALSLACEEQKDDIVKLLIDYKANVNICDKRNRSPLHFVNASLRYSSKAPTDYSYIIAKYLLENKADVNKSDNEKLKPIHIAVETKDLKLTKLLLEYKADVNVKNICVKNTPLHLLIKKCEKIDKVGMEIIELLIDNGAQIDAKNKNLQTPLHCACLIGNTEIVNYLIQRGAKIDELCIYDPGKNFRDDDDQEKPIFSALDLAVIQGNCEIIKILLKKVNKNLADRAIYCAVLNHDYYVTKLLLDCGISTNGIYLQNMSILHKAMTLTDSYLSERFLNFPSEYLAEGIIYLLLIYGSDVNTKNDFNQSPLLFAYSKSSKHCKILLKYLILLKLQGKNSNTEELEMINEASFINDCEIELSKMKNDIICDNISVFSVLNKSINSLSEYLRNKNMFENFNIEKIKTDYPIYCNIIKQKFDLALSRRKHLDLGYPAMTCLYENIITELQILCIPDIVTEKILKYLNINDLDCLSKICCK